MRMFSLVSALVVLPSVASASPIGASFTGGSIFLNGSSFNQTDNLSNNASGPGNVATDTFGGTGSTGSGVLGRQVGASINVGGSITTGVSSTVFTFSAVGTAFRDPPIEGNANLSIGTRASINSDPRTKIELTIDTLAFFTISQTNNGFQAPTFSPGTGSFQGSFMTPGTYFFDFELFFGISNPDTTVSRSLTWTLTLVPTPGSISLELIGFITLGRRDRRQ